MLTQPQLHSDAVNEFDRQPPVAYVETDRFCDGCGYNLRTQPVRRDLRTGVLLCRCPECGRFHPARDGATAGHVWLRRLGTLALFAWILAIVAAFLGLGGAQIGFNMLTLEELTTYRQLPVPTISLPTSLPNLSLPPGASITISTGSPSSWQRQVRVDVPHYQAFMVLMHALSFAAGFVLMLLAVVICHHWRRWAYFIPAVIVPSAAAACVWFVWSTDHPQLAAWAAPYISGQAAAHLAGGLTGILLGRPLTRLAVLILLPPRLQQVLTFLWLADHKRAPTSACPA